MGVNPPAEISVPLKEAHRRAIDQANSWRGRCVNLFARGEVIIGQCLRTQQGSKPLQMLLSQRISRLATLIEGQPKKSAALKDFAAQADFRNAIVHGDGKIWVNGEGGWLLTLQTVGRSGVSQLQFAQADAEDRAKQLKSVVDRLSAALRA